MNAPGLRRRLLELARGELIRHGIVLFAAITVVNISNYLFHVIVSRMLGPAEYGALGGLLSAFVWISILAGALQLVVAKHVSVLRVAGDDASAGRLVLSILLRGATWSAVVGLLAGLASPWIATFLNLGSTLPAVLLALYVVPGIVGPLARGGLQGRLLFRPLAFVTAGTTVLRLVLGILFVDFGWGVAGAVGATVIAEVVGVAWAVWPIRNLLRRAIGGARLMPEAFAREASLAVLAIGGFWAIINADTLMVRHYLPGDPSGFYTAAAVTARSVLFFPAAVVIVVFPHFAALRDARDQGRRLLAQAAALVTVLGLIAAAVLTLFPRTAIGTLFGQKFLAGADLLPTLGLAMALFGVVNVFVYFHLAQGGRAAWGVVGAFAAQLAGIALFHESIMEVARLMLVIATVFLAYNSVAGWLATRPRELLLTLEDEAQAALAEHRVVREGADV